MRLDVDSSMQPGSPSPLEASANFTMGPSGPQEYMRAGIHAAQSGDRTTARAMFTRSAELNPNDPNIWLWLASISEYPEELMGFVGRVLDLDPYNERAIQWRTATCSLLAKTFIQRGSDAVESDQSMYAEDCFNKALEYDAKSTAALMWLASLATNDDVRRRHLNRIIELDPEHSAAINALNSMNAEREKAEFDDLRRLAAEGDVITAVNLLSGFTQTYPSNLDSWLLLSHLSSEPAIKISALEKVLNLDPQHQAAKASLDSLIGLFGDLSVDRSAEEPPSKTLDAEEICNEIAMPDDALVPAAPLQDQSVEAVMEEQTIPDEAPIQPPIEDLIVTPIEAAVPEQAEIFTDTNNELNDLSIDAWEAVEADFENDWNRKTEAYSSEDIHVSEFLAVLAPAEEKMEEDGYSIPMPEIAILDEAIKPERTGFETVVDSPAGLDVTPLSNCPYCSAPNENSAFSCRSCLAVLTLADLESLIDNKNAATYLIRRAVDSMESQRNSREFSEIELTTLGIGHLNLRNLQFGYDRLLEASRANPDNIVLSSHVNSLLIRMDEIRRQEEAHSRMATGKNILVVDDSPTIRKLIAGKLEKSGHNVLLCEDGEKALEAIRSVVPDLVLLDIKMPGLDGYDVCRQIRGWVSTASVPIVMISGKDGYFDKVRGRLAGSTGYITKPFGPETLMKAIEFYLGGGSDLETEAGETVEAEEYELAISE